MFNRLIVLILALFSSLYYSKAQSTPSAVAIESNGWRVVTYLQDVTSSNMMFFNGMLTNNNSLTVTSKFSIEFQTPGFDINGNAVMVNRTNWGTKLLRQPYSAAGGQNTNLVVVSGGVTMPVIASSEWFSSFDSNLTARLLEGAFVETNDVTDSAAAVLTSVTNKSTLPFPRVIAHWYNTVPYDLVGSSYTLGVSAWHYSGKDFYPVACVKGWAVSASGVRSTTNIARMRLNYNAPTPSIYWEITIDGSGFAQNEEITNYFKVFPWWGNSLDSSDGVNSPEYHDYNPLILFCNKNGTAKAVYANVDPTNGVSTGVATTNRSEWAAATPFQNIGQAANAAGATNNTRNGINSLGNCFIALTNGDYKFWDTTLSSRTAPTNWLTIMARPDLTDDWRQVVRIYTNLNNQTGQKDLKLRFQNVCFTWTNNASMVSQGYKAIDFNQIEVWTNLQSGATLFAFHTNVWVRNSLIRRVRPGFTYVIGTSNSWVKCWDTEFRGFARMTNTTTFNCVSWIGNLINPPSPESYVLKNDSAVINPCDPFIWAFSRFYNADAAVFPIAIGIETNLVIGGVVAQCLIEATRSFVGIPYDIMQSQKANETCSNLLSIGNTVLGVYHPPFEIGNVNGRTIAWFKDENNVFADIETSGDIGSADADNTNRWAETTYSVGRSGNVFMELNANFANPAGQEKGWDGINTIYTFTNINYAYFVTNQSYFSANTNGLGDYHGNGGGFIGANLVRNHWFKWDGDGNLRRANGAAGFYEVNPIRTAYRGKTIIRGKVMSTNFTETLNNGLVAYWKMDETSGNRADSIGTITLFDSNTVTSATGKIGNGAEFVESNSEFLQSGSDPAAVDFNGSSSFTFNAWINTASDADPTKTILSKTDSGQKQYHLAHIVPPSGMECMISGNGLEDAGSVTNKSTVTISLSTWYFVSFVRDSANELLKLRINGVTYQTGAVDNSIINGTAPFRVGTFSITGNFFDGIIDEVSAYNRALTDSEIDALYNSGDGRRPSSVP
jgi:hypothetical protein